MTYHKRRTEESPKPVSKYLKEMDFAINRPWTYCPKEGLYTYVNGKKLSKKEFDKRYPVFRPAHFYVCLDNPDKTRIYLQ
jgi:hypothetical protein